MDLEIQQVFLNRYLKMHIWINVLLFAGFFKRGASIFCIVESLAQASILGGGRGRKTGLKRSDGRGGVTWRRRRFP